MIKVIEAGRVLTMLPLKTPSHFQPYDYFALLLATQTFVALKGTNLGQSSVSSTTLKKEQF